MKILCIQLARFGDIYQTWPSLAAFRRLNPEAELHLLVREKFADATVGLDVVDQVRVLKTSEILGPLLKSDENIPQAIEVLNGFLEILRGEKYDKIVNLSFSPFSSFLVEYISQPQTQIFGYSRFEDGSLKIGDDISSYFYAQVGVGRANHIHLTDIFAMIMGVELSESDQYVNYARIPGFDRSETRFNDPYIVIHVGASQSSKSLDVQTWRILIDRICNHCSEKIVLVGATNEKFEIANSRVINLCGTTKIYELFHLLRNARAVVGGDSVVIHMASLSGTPTLNLSSGSVNFWETGPRAPVSRIIWFAELKNIDTERVACELSRVIKGEPAGPDVISKTVISGILYNLDQYGEADYEWELVRALYLGDEFPKFVDPVIGAGFRRIGEAAQTALLEIKNLASGKVNQHSVDLIENADQLMQGVAGIVPVLRPLISWFQTEKIRIGPEQISEVLRKTEELYVKLIDICDLNSINQNFETNFPRGDLTWKP